MSGVRVVAFSLTGKWASLSSGVTVPVTHLFTEDGDETGNPEVCALFVCGSDETGWFGFCVEDFEEVKVS